MNVLLINRFFFMRGGTEAVFFRTAEALKKRGHKTAFFSMRHPSNIAGEYEKYFSPEVDLSGEGGVFKKIKNAAGALYSFGAEKALGRLLDEQPVDIAHLFGINHQLSPSVLSALRKRRVPAVMSLHDLKLVCPSYYMLSRGRHCERCRGKRFYHCALEGCHKGSRMQSLVLTAESWLNHGILKSYRDIRCYVCPSDFIARTCREMGLEGDFVRIYNPVDASEWKPFSGKRDDYIIYVGRLSREKGITTLIDAVKGLPVKLKIAGDGPLKEMIETRLVREKIDNVELLGYLKPGALEAAIGRSRALVFPSECCEAFGLSIAEAFSMQVPVIGSDLGAVPELVRDGKTGLIFRAGDPADLRGKIVKLTGEPETRERMGIEGRRFVESNFSPDKYCERVLEVYNKAMDKNA